MITLGPTLRGRASTFPWLLLVAVDLAALAGLARCFTGPGELVLVLAVCACVHLVVGGPPRLLVSLRPGAKRASVHALCGCGWVIGLALAFLVPLVALDGRSLALVLPLGRTWRVVDHQLSVAWVIFSDKLAPVREAPGLVLVSAWAAGLVALASELLYADTALPAVVALVPAFDVVVFVGTLGTSVDKWIWIAGLAALALLFLGGLERRSRLATSVDVVPDGEGGPTRRRRSSIVRRSGRPTRATALVAALAAGLAGPLLPGAASAPLVAVHRNLNGPAVPGGSKEAAQVVVSDLVQAADEEIVASHRLLFIVHSRIRLRESLVSLDRFNGESWSAGPRGDDSPVRPLARPLESVLAQPPPPRPLPGGRALVTQAVVIRGLGGDDLPVPGTTQALVGTAAAVVAGSDGAVQAGVGLRAGFAYGVGAVIAPSPSRRLDSDPVGSSPSLRWLPRPVPARLVALARRIVAGAESPYAKAVRLEQYFLSGHGYRYVLPARPPSGPAADTDASYRALENFLFSTRAGYCQQFATSFAVLGRIVGLPTRLVVGFLPGRETARDTYEVTGAQVHAWPEVDFSHAGWVAFEPTPGGSSPTGGVAPGRGTRPSLPRATGGGAQGLRAKSSGPTNRPGGRGAARPAPTGVGPVARLAAVVLLVLLLVAVAAAVASRASRRRRPAREATLAAWEAALFALATAGARREKPETRLEFARRVVRIGVLPPATGAALVRLALRSDEATYASARHGLPPGGAIAAEKDANEVRRALRRRLVWWRRCGLSLVPARVGARILGRAG